MTSKQAKKLYKEATRVPRRSKAEQRRLELEEQERIRRELKEDQKKLRKELDAGKAPRRQGEEEVEGGPAAAGEEEAGPAPGQRPASQDTIARFVRGSGTAKRKAPCDTLAEEVESDPENQPPAASGASADDLLPEPKRRRRSCRLLSQQGSSLEPRRDGRADPGPRGSDASGASGAHAAAAAAAAANAVVAAQAQSTVPAKRPTTVRQQASFHILEEEEEPVPRSPCPAVDCRTTPHECPCRRSRRTS